MSAEIISQIASETGMSPEELEAQSARSQAESGPAPQPTEAELYHREVNERFGIVSALIVREVNLSLAKHGPLKSVHEGLGVMYEEFDEYTDAVRANDPDNIAEELVQIAAVAIRALIDTVPRSSVEIVQVKARAEDAKLQAQQAQAAARAA